MEPALDLGPDRRLLVVHPARDHLPPNRSLLIGQVGRPELRRVEPRICDLLVAIPLGEILTQVLAQLHSMRLRIARVARELLRQLIEPSRGFRIGFRQSQRSEEHTSELQSLMRISY